MTRIQRILISLFLRSRSGILLLRRRTPYSEFVAHDPKSRLGLGLWELPGGGLDFAEAPLKAGVRETYEETGTLIDPGDLKLAACCAYTLRSPSCESHRIHVIYSANVSAPLQVNLSSEHAAYKWVRSLSAFQDFSMVPELRSVIADSL